MIVILSVVSSGYMGQHSQLVPVSCYILACVAWSRHWSRNGWNGTYMQSEKIDTSLKDFFL